MALHPLDAPAWSALTGAQSRFAGAATAAAVRFDPEVSVFGAWDPDLPVERGWQELARVIAPGSYALVALERVEPPVGWPVTFDLTGLQMVADEVDFDGDPELVPLEPEDADEMAALVELTRPGPWAPRTWELGGYVGIRRDGRIAAMAGERLRPEGWAEVSAVCTHPDFRGQGLGGRLVRAVTASIQQRGEGAFLHVAGTNTGAIRLYEQLGYSVRRPAHFVVTGPPSP